MGRKTKSGSNDELAETREAPAAPHRLTLLAAGEAVIREKGFARTTVEEVAARAGLTPDVFHAHFSGKGALLRALCEAWVDQLSSVTTDASRSGIWATSSAIEVVDVAARSAIDAIYEHAPIVRAVLVHGASDPTLTASLRKIGTLLTKRVVKVIRESEREGEPRIEERQVAFCLLAAIALAHQAILVGAHSTGVPFDKDELASEASKLVAAYLGAGSARAVVPPAPPSANARTGKTPARGNNRPLPRV